VDLPLALEAVPEQDRKMFILNPNHRMSCFGKLEFTRMELKISIAKTAKTFVGVDVSKATLDVYRPDTNELLKIENSEDAINQLRLHFQKKKRQEMFVLEGTGGYEYLLLRCLASHKLDASVINPRRVRDFAKGIGLDAKTDPIDARVISR